MNRLILAGLSDVAEPHGRTQGVMQSMSRFRLAMVLAVFVAAPALAEGDKGLAIDIRSTAWGRVEISGGAYHENMNELSRFLIDQNNFMVGDPAAGLPWRGMGDAHEGYAPGNDAGVGYLLSGFGDTMFAVDRLGHRTVTQLIGFEDNRYGQRRGLPDPSYTFHKLFSMPPGVSEYRSFARPRNAPVAVPEPASFVILLSAVTALALRRRGSWSDDCDLPSSRSGAP